MTTKQAKEQRNFQPNPNTLKSEDSLTVGLLFPYLNLVTSPEGLSHINAEAQQVDQQYQAEREIHHQHIPTEITSRDVHRYHVAFNKELASRTGVRVAQTEYVTTINQVIEQNGLHEAAETRAFNYRVITFIQKFSQRMRTRMGDTVPEVTFGGYPIIIPYGEKSKSGSWVQQLWNEVQGSQVDFFHYFKKLECLMGELVPEIRMTQINQVLEKCQGNDAAALVTLESMLADKNYAPYMTAKIITSISYQGITNQQRRLTTGFTEKTAQDKTGQIVEAGRQTSVMMSTVGVVAENGQLSSTFREIQRDQLATKKTELADVMEVISFADFKPEHTAGFSLQTRLLQMAKLIGDGAAEYQLYKLWIAEVANRLGDLYLQLELAHHNESKFSAGKQLNQTTQSNLDQFATLVETMVQQSIEVVNAQLPKEHYQLVLTPEKVRLAMKTKYLLRAHSGMSTRNELAAIRKLSVFANSYAPRPRS